MAKTRGNREGTVYQRGNGTWCGQATVGWDWVTGKVTPVTVYGKTCREVVAKRKQAVEQVQGSQLA
jgi:hypothetical protein